MNPSTTPSDHAITRMPWIPMGAVLLGTIMVALEQATVSIALPRIGTELGALDGVDWVVSAYLLALGVVQPTMGWLADQFGRRRVFLGSLALFGFGALVAGLAQDLPQLIAARVVQGVGGGAIFPVGMAMIWEQVPPARRGFAMGTWSLGIASAPAFGPTIAGILVTTVGWRSLFFMSVPFALLAFVVGWRVLRFSGFRERRRFDSVGFGLVTVGLAAILYAVSEANTWGWTSPPTLVLGGVGLVMLVLFTFHELREPEPLIDLRMFAIPAYSVAMIIVAVMVSVMLARVVFLPLELVTLRGLSEIEVGLILTPSALSGAVAAPLAGWLTDRIGARLPVVAGLICLAVASVLMATLSLETPVVAIAAFVALQGIGHGLALTPNHVAGMNSLPQRLLARGTAIRSTTRQVAGSFSIAILTAVLIARIGGLERPATQAGVVAAQEAYNLLFLICAVAAVACLILALRWVPHSEQMRENASARSVEHSELVSRR